MDNRTTLLGVVDAALIVTGSIIGAGIFLVSGVVAQTVDSPAAFLGTWIVGGFVALAGALSNGELGALFPRGGGEYVYLREAYGPLLGFLSGWTSFFIGFPGSIATLASGLGRAIVALTGAPTRGTATIVAVVAIALLTLVNAFGLRPGRWTQNVLSVAKLATLVALLAVGLLIRREAPSHFVPFSFDHTDTARGFAMALVPVFFAYSGWNAATYVAGEIRPPARNVGRALALGTSVCMLLYVAVNVVYLRALSISEIRTSANLAAAAAERLGWQGAATILTALLAIAVTSSLQATILTGPRIYQAMAEDRLFFSMLGHKHPRTNAPTFALVAQGVIAGVLLVSGTFDRLVTFTTFALVLFSMLTVVGVFVLRARRPEADRPFRAFGYPLTPAFFVVANAWILWTIVTSSPREAIVGLAIVGTGVPAYFWFHRRESARLVTTR